MEWFFLILLFGRATVTAGNLTAFTTHELTATMEGQITATMGNPIASTKRNPTTTTTDDLTTATTSKPTASTMDDQTTKMDNLATSAVGNPLTMTMGNPTGTIKRNPNTTIPDDVTTATTSTPTASTMDDQTTKMDNLATSAVGNPLTMTMGNPTGTIKRNPITTIPDDVTTATTSTPTASTMDDRTTKMDNLATSAVGNPLTMTMSNPTGTIKRNPITTTPDDLTTATTSTPTASTMDDQTTKMDNLATSAVGNPLTMTMSNPTGTIKTNPITTTPEDLTTATTSKPAAPTTKDLTTKKDNLATTGNPLTITMGNLTTTKGNMTTSTIGSLTTTTSSNPNSTAMLNPTISIMGNITIIIPENVTIINTDNTTTLLTAMGTSVINDSTHTAHLMTTAIPDYSDLSIINDTETTTSPHFSSPVTTATPDYSELPIINDTETTASPHFSLPVTTATPEYSDLPIINDTETTTSPHFSSPMTTATPDFSDVPTINETESTASTLSTHSLTTEKPVNSTSAPSPVTGTPTDVTATPFTPNTTRTHVNSTHPTLNLPTTPYMPPSSTNPPLRCANGGTLGNGLCVCPDKWIGDTCEKANFCKQTEIGHFTFKETLVGWFSYSKEICGEGTTNDGISQASVRCLNESGSLKFGSLRVLECDLTLRDLQRNVTNTGDFAQIAASMQIMTSQPQQLQADNITTVAMIASSLLSSNSSQVPQEVAVAVVTTISQILDATNFPEGDPDNSIVGLTIALEEFSLAQTNGSQVVQPNLVVQSVRVPKGDTLGIQFSAQTGPSGGFVANRIFLNTNASEMTVNNSRTSDVQIYIKFQPGRSRENKGKTSAGFVLYQSDKLFRSNFSNPLGSSTRVISANVSTMEKLDHVELLFRPETVPNASLYNFACVFWNYTLGHWSTDGCSKVNDTSGNLRCSCNHTTNFAVLMSFRIDYRYAKALDWITRLGCSLSIVGLGITIIFQILTRKSRKNDATMLLVSVCLSLLVFYLLFLCGINNPNKDKEPRNTSSANQIFPSDKHKDPDDGPCTAIAALLQYFLLATFTWNSLYATQMFLLVHNVFAMRPRHFGIIALAIGWGFPAAVVAVTLAATYREDDPLNFRQEEFCWLAALDRHGKFDIKKPMLWAFLLPVAVMLIYNTGVLIYFTVVTCRTDPNLKSTRTNPTMTNILSSFSLAVVLGLSWTLGYLMLIKANIIFNIIFCVLTTTQGLQIFILFTARTLAFRKLVCNALRSVPVPRIALRSRNFSLWRQKGDRAKETYKTMDTEMASHSYFTASSEACSTTKDSC